MKPISASGFFSYRQIDNKADDDYLTKLRVNLQEEISVQTGQKITIWQDKNNIQWGEQWKGAIEKGLEEAAFFIPIITPGYLLSKGCCDEFHAFVEYEKGKKRTDLILPLIYVRPDDFDDETAKKENNIIRIVLDRQYADWESLRHYGEERIEYRQKITELGQRVRKLLKSMAPVPAAKVEAEHKTRKKGKDTKKAGTSSLAKKIDSAIVRWTPKTGPPVKMDIRRSAGEKKADYESQTETA